MYVLSPWSRGGRVFSEVSDHTSVIRFMEERFGVREPNISPWRRAVSDLTSLSILPPGRGRPRCPPGLWPPWPPRPNAQGGPRHQPAAPPFRARGPAAAHAGPRHPPGLPARYRLEDDRRAGRRRLPPDASRRAKGWRACSMSMTGCGWMPSRAAYRRAGQALEADWALEGEKRRL
jgi:phospholipase C